MLAWLCASLGVAFATAVVPVLSIEIFVIGLATSEQQIPWPAIGAVVAVGQVTGKLLYFLAARGSIRLPDLLHNRLHRPDAESGVRARWRRRTERVRLRLEMLRERCHRHPYWMAGTYGMSSVVGLPPFMATTVLAGLVRMRMSMFVTAGLLGRFVRFSVLAASPAIFASAFGL